MNPPRAPGIWFPAKRYGWGWGPPVTWQGWAVIAVWIALFFAGLLLLGPISPLVHVQVAQCCWNQRRIDPIGVPSKAMSMLVWYSAS